MWMAMLCSVTVSMGEDRRGAFNVTRFVTGVSRVTSEAGKPCHRVQSLTVSHEFSTAAYRYIRAEQGSHCRSRHRACRNQVRYRHQDRPWCNPFPESPAPWCGPETRRSWLFQARHRWQSAFWKRKRSTVSIKTRRRK
ncbi:uncharacterized protein BJX67DRAFT_361898 [Aspergillus lucknowensis]|uniref:Secreted protein n=1 Tax=Aspergillus lucknowensis TaxID=176173 RepID=A0ABR4LLE6_9EURO